MLNLWEGEFTGMEWASLWRSSLGKQRTRGKDESSAFKLLEMDIHFCGADYKHMQGWDRICVLLCRWDAIKD